MRKESRLCRSEGGEVAGCSLCLTEGTRAKPKPLRLWGVQRKNKSPEREVHYLGYLTNRYRREVDERLPNLGQCRPCGPCRPRGICCLGADHFFARGSRRVWRSG